MAVTIRDVAALAGVHVSTVSRAMSAPHLVNAATRERVMAAARQLGYRPNRAASALTTGRTHNLGLIVADIANPFFPPLIKAAQAYAREREYHVFVADTDEDPQIEEELIGTLAKQVDGVVLVAPRLSNQSIERLSLELPFVVVNRQVKGVSAVLMDIGHGTGLAVEHLLGLGHRRLLLLAGPRGSWSSAQMERAARLALLERDDVELVISGPNAPTEMGGIAAAEGVGRSGATGVIAYNDLVAIGVIEGLTRAGVRVPEEVSVVGVDDTVAGRLNRPKLTTIVMPTPAAGRSAVDLLLQTIDGGGVSAQTSLQTSLVERESTGPAPAG